MPHFIHVHDLTVGYNGHPAVHHLSGTFEAGSLTAVTGPNGSGKSTLLKAIVGLLRPLGGHVDRDGLTSREMAYLPQQAEIDRTFPITVLDMVALGHWQTTGLFGRVSRAQWRAAHEALETVGLSGFERRPIGSLSAGQFQRVLFGRLLLQDAPLVILDEPFTAMDAATTAVLLRLVLTWHEQGRTVMAVVHDLAQVRDHFPRTLLLARDPVAWGPTAEVLTEENLARANGMAEAWDENAEVCREVPA
ncbi:ABC transporter related protein [Desulfovibrio sp. X2]|uniref:metal ABC transporter ATP-binding protein n=1 Tax=Desulfovibrio sp. X2 TaxID=941449 RepID=UPI000358B457|nr:ABC transporter ATP-binding protein [Desulfovibrio sp. X2]EPR44278.1 ABC transporter related protein [Desulfovibrio sp. X2]